MAAAVKRKPSTPIVRQHPFTVAMMEQREAMGLGYQALADKIGSGSRSYLRDIELGKYAVSVEMGLAICQVLDIPPSFCIDYIQEVEMSRIQDNIKAQYTEWAEYIPKNVLGQMLKTQSARKLHESLLGG